MTPFHEQLKHYRERAGLNINQLADKSLYDRAFVNRLEKPPGHPLHRNPKRETVQRLAQALGLSEVEEDRLLFAAGFAPVDPKNLLDDPRLGEIDEILTDLDEERRAMLGTRVEELWVYAQEFVEDPLD